MYVVLFFFLQRIILFHYFTGWPCLVIFYIFINTGGTLLDFLQNQNGCLLEEEVKSLIHTVFFSFVYFASYYFISLLQKQSANETIQFILEVWFLLFINVIQVKTLC